MSAASTCRGGSAIARAKRRVPLVDERRERLVHVVHAAPERFRERFRVLRALGVRLQQRLQRGLTVERHEVLDDERRLEVGDRQRLGTLERVRQLLHAERLALAEQMRELERQLASPRGIAPVLLVDGDALREPARHAVVGQLQREDVRELVPERAPAS